MNHVFIFFAFLLEDNDYKIFSKPISRLELCDFPIKIISRPLIQIDSSDISYINLMA